MCCIAFLVDKYFKVVQLLVGRCITVGLQRVSAEYFENEIRFVSVEVKIHDFIFWACEWMEKNICSFNIPSWNWNTKFANELWLSVQMFAISVNFHFICSLYVSWVEIFLHAMRMEWHHHTHTQHKAQNNCFESVPSRLRLWSKWSQWCNNLRMTYYVKTVKKFRENLNIFHSEKVAPTYHFSINYSEYFERIMHI